MERNLIALQSIGISEIDDNNYNIKYPYLLKIVFHVSPPYEKELFIDIEYHSRFQCVHTITLYSTNTVNKEDDQIKFYCIYIIFKNAIDKDIAISKLEKIFKTKIQDLSFCKEMKVLYRDNKMIGYNVSEYDKNDDISYSVLYVKEEDKHYYNGELPYLVAGEPLKSKQRNVYFEKPLKIEHPKIKIKIVAERKELIPTYATSLSSGFDIKANITESIKIGPGERVLIPTGLKVAIPPGYELQIRSKSGLALKNGISVLNSPGTIDADYNGEVKIICINHSNSNSDFIVQPLMKICQGIICPIYQADFVEVNSLENTERNSGGFGSTGLF